jgi:hypothetical protein
MMLTEKHPGFASEMEWTGRLLATGETQRRVADFLAGARR